MKYSCGCLLAALALVVLASPVSAHHSISSVFDPNAEADVTGTITAVHWINPHVYWHIDVKNPTTGEIENWRIESSNPVEFRQAGVTRTMAGKPGETVHSHVYLARDGTKHLAFGLWFEFPSDGRKIITKFDIRRGSYQKALDAKKAAEAEKAR